MKTRSKQSQPQIARKLDSFPDGWFPLTHQILNDGTLAVLVANMDLRSEWQRIFEFNQTKQAQLEPPSKIDSMVERATAQILLMAHKGWVQGPSFPLETTFPMIDRLSDGRWLVAGARILSNTNARVLTSDGELLHRLMLGDGIENLGVDAKDRIWVGWFDEGVFGNDTWRIAQEEWPPSSLGVACFDLHGALVPQPDWPKGADSIADCYAMNVVDDGAWVCTYTDFPLVHLSPEYPSQWWQTKRLGTRAIAISGEYAILAGGYGSDANTASLVTLDPKKIGRKADSFARLELPLQKNTTANGPYMHPWMAPTLLAGRKDVLHLVDAGHWCQWSLPDLLRDLGI
jgi:hypothetical protein